MDMVSTQRKKNLIVGEDETPHEKETPPSPKSLGQFFEEIGIEWEQKGRAYYAYPNSIQGVKEILEKVPLPQADQYIIIPLGQASGYSVFVMVTKSGISIRIGYGKNSIPYVSALNGILEKVGKIAKELGLETRKNGKNLLE